MHVPTDRRIAARTVPRRRASPAAELTTVALGTWLMVGLFIDGWAHANRPELESFFTPWHGIFYAGFTATAAWIAWLVHRNQERGLRGRAAVPVGYGLGLVGAGIFAAGGLGDMAWHEVFGVEQEIEALFSPTHLLLFVGIVLILSSPFRAAWTADPVAAAPRFAAFLPALLSTALTASLLAFMFMFLSVFTGTPSSVAAVDWAVAQRSAEVDASTFLLIEGLAGHMATNLLLVGPLLLLARRWRLPFGTAATLFTVHALLVSAIREFSTPWKIGAALLAGLLVDLLVRRLGDIRADRRRLWALGGLAPLLVWSVYFAGVAVFHGIGWAPELWTGTIMWSALVGGMVALVMDPPAADGAVPVRDPA